MFSLHIFTGYHDKNADNKKKSFSLQCVINFADTTTAIVKTLFMSICSLELGPNKRNYLLCIQETKTHQFKPVSEERKNTFWLDSS